MVAPKRRIKLFNRLLREFLEDYKKIYGKEYSIRANDITFLNLYKDEVNFVIDDFFDCNSSSFENISLCKSLELSSINIGANIISIWKYLQNLYILTLEATDKEPVIERSKKSLEKLEIEETQNINIDGIAKNLETSISQNTEFGNLIQDIAGHVSKSLEGKDLSNINPMDLISGLMSGNASNINGIDFSEILKKTTNTIQSKVNSGELDINKLKEQADSLIKPNYN